MLEYATLPDIKKLPYGKVKDYLSRARIDKFWCDKQRKSMFSFLLPYLSASDSWEEAISLMLDQYFDSMESKKGNKN